MPICITRAVPSHESLLLNFQEFCKPAVQLLVVCLATVGILTGRKLASTTKSGLFFQRAILPGHH